MITIDEVAMTVDETMRQFGTNEIRLSLSVSDRTPFYDRTWDSQERYGYRARLYGFGRDGTPSRDNATLISPFGSVVQERQLVCSYFPRYECRWEFRSRVLETHRYQELAGDSTENRQILLGRARATVVVDDLDVDPEEPPIVFRMRGRPITIRRPRADSLFCTVDVVDFGEEDAIVASDDTNIVTDFFGRNEPRTGTGDDRFAPVQP